jgi:hypothetical protein
MEASKQHGCGSNAPNMPPAPGGTPGIIIDIPMHVVTPHGTPVDIIVLPPLPPV